MKVLGAVNFMTERSKAIARSHPAMRNWVTRTFDREARKRTADKEIFIIAVDPNDCFLMRGDAPSISFVGWAGLKYSEYNFLAALISLRDLEEKPDRHRIVVSAWHRDVMRDW
jgi:hypothetical protein